MSIGFFGSKLLKLNLKQAITIAIESGIQNGTLTISLAVITVGKPELAIVAAVYGPLMYLMALVPIGFGARKFKK